DARVPELLLDGRERGRKGPGSRADGLSAPRLLHAQGETLDLSLQVPDAHHGVVGLREAVADGREQLVLRLEVFRGRGGARMRPHLRPPPARAPPYSQPDA